MPSKHLVKLRGLADNIKTAKPAPDLVARPAARLDFTTGTVTQIRGDGSAVVAVYGDTQSASSVGAVPAVGQTVAVVIKDGALTILGPITGIPTF